VHSLARGWRTLQARGHVTSDPLLKSFELAPVRLALFPQALDDRLWT
jgi:hypothetical protein